MVKDYTGPTEESFGIFDVTKKHCVVPTFKRMIDDVSGKSCLDLGCGSGFFTRGLAKLGAIDVMGVDISSDLVWRGIEIESLESLGVGYLHEDVLDLDLKKKFDLISAVYLLNYFKSKHELVLAFKKIYSHLKEGGSFCSVVINPKIKPMREFEYERKFESITDKSFFKDGEIMRVVINQKGKKEFEFVNYYWSKEVYEAALNEAGFENVEFVNPIISHKGVEEMGLEYWSGFRKSPSILGIKCTK